MKKSPHCSAGSAVMTDDRNGNNMNGNMKNYRKLNPQEIEQLKAQMCTAADWDQVEVSADFSADHVRSARFSGNVKIGAFSKEFVLPGGMVDRKSVV